MTRAGKAEAESLKYTGFFYPVRGAYCGNFLGNAQVAV